VTGGWEEGGIGGLLVLLLLLNLAEAHAGQR
jgi:hypothetical protein